VALSSAAGMFAAEVADLSVGGMFVRTDRAPPVGELVSAELEIPDGKRPALLDAKVVHVAPSIAARRSTSRRGFGAQFVRIEEPVRERMHRYIESIESGSEIPVRLLIVARDLLYEKGWTQLSECDARGSYCLTGALSYAAGDDRDGYRNALQSLGPRLGVPACSFGGFSCHCAVLSWNDTQGRTRQHVVAKLDEVIDFALNAGASV
jgi:Tfp pilus assembly protein PilZ